MGISIPDSIKNRIDLGNINFAEIKQAITRHCQSLTSLLMQADRKALLQALSVVVGIYCFIFLYVYLFSSSTISKLEDRMAKESVELTQGEAFGHSKMNAQYYADANLVEGLSKLEDVGRIPIIRPHDQFTSFRAYQIPFEFQGYDQRTFISFMLKDFGLSKNNSEMALEILPPEVSFLLSPYAQQPMEWVKRARSKGHEVWLDIPVQSDTYPGSGLNTIFHHQNLSEKSELLHGSLTSALGYVGVGMYLDDSIRPVEDHYKKISDELYGRGLGVFEKNPKAPQVIESIAVARGAPFIKADIEVFQMKGQNSFVTLEAIARKKKHAVATIPAYPTVMKHLAMWIDKVGRADYAVAPVSAIYDLPIERNSAKQADAPSGLHPTDHAAQPIDNHGH